MKHVSHVAKRGPWCGEHERSVRGPYGTSSTCCSSDTVSRTRECACGALSDRMKPMPAQWSHHMVDGQSIFTCSTLCRLQRGLK